MTEHQEHLTKAERRRESGGAGGVKLALRKTNSQTLLGKILNTLTRVCVCAPLIRAGEERSTDRNLD